MIQESGDHISGLGNQLQELMKEKTELLEKTNAAESLAKDFEYMLLEAERRIEQMIASNKEEDLGREIDLLKSEIERLTEAKEEIQTETRDMSKEIHEIKVALNGAESKNRLLAASLKQAEEERQKLDAKWKTSERAEKEAREAILEREKKVYELQVKLSEETKLRQELKKKIDVDTVEHANKLSKLEEDNQILHGMINRLREENETSGRMRKVSAISVDAKNMSRKDSEVGANASEKGDCEMAEPVIPMGQEENEKGNNLDEEEENDVFAEVAMNNGGAQQVEVSGSGFLRRDTFDTNRMGGSNLQSRRNSNISTRFMMGRFGGRNPDEKLLADLNEAKSKLKLSQEDHEKRVKEIMVE